MSKYITDNEELMKEWNYEKNKDINPYRITSGSKLKVWWICPKGHEWLSRIDHRFNGSKCIYCTNQKAVSGENDVKTTHPDLIKEWDYDKNYPQKPEDYKAGSNVKVWWKCKLGHNWQATINHRTNGSGCPKCYSEYGTSFPEQAICYYLSKVTDVKNRYKIGNQEIDIYLPEYQIGFEYDGKYYHNSKQSLKKERLKEEVLKKNNIVLYRIKEADKNYIDKMKRIIYCLTDRDYSYLKYVLEKIFEIIKVKINFSIDIDNNRTDIYVQYMKTIKENSITSKYPDLLKEWDYDKNNGLSPDNLSFGSNKKVWWICKKCKSSYLSSISHKCSGTSCPYCNGKSINETNNLKAKYPRLCKHWDYEKNNNRPENVYFRSRKKVWWICETCGKSFSAPICSRIRAKKYDCSECMHKRIGIKNSRKEVK